MTPADEKVAAGMTAAAEAIRAFADGRVRGDMRAANAILEALQPDVLLWASRMMLRSLGAVVAVAMERQPEAIHGFLHAVAGSLDEEVAATTALLIVDAEAIRLGIDGDGGPAA